MSPRDRLIAREHRKPSGGAAAPGDPPGPRRGPFDEESEQHAKRVRNGRLIGSVTVVALVALIAAAVLKNPGGLTGIDPGRKIPPFAVPLATGTLTGDANVATHAHEGASGNVPACRVRGSQVLNVCELAERGPVVLALFVNSSSCTQVLSEMQALTSSFPGVQFAAVAIKGSRSGLRSLVSRKGLTFPVGLDEDGTLASLYKVLSCPQVNLAYPGGKVQSRALLSNPTQAQLRSRVAALVAASRARGWHGGSA
ncbi:MAG TPA: redoxin domain-containing protein [Solirubrobacteraceae bacterium]|nr:redoxin domain-containing protein [Solirubrobacteraceae bacterium]